MRPKLGEIHGLQCLTTQPYIPEDLGLPRTLICKIKTPLKTLSVRALIDPGSVISAIKRNTARKLSLEGPKRNLRFGTSGAQQIIFRNMMVVNFQLASLDGKFITDFQMEAITMPEITFNINKIKINPLEFDHLKNVKFSEKLPMDDMTSTKVELLIGEPITTYLFKKLIAGDIGQPSAIIYQIGACLSGAANPKKEKRAIHEQQNFPHDHTTSLNMLSTAEIYEEDPAEYIKSWFTLENVGIEDPSTSSQLSAEEQKAEELMEKNTYYDGENKCYHTRLLWIDEPMPYPNIRRASAAATRMVKRFSKEDQEDAWNSIEKIYKSNLADGISEVVPSKDLKKTEDFHYICMSMVFKPESATTPVRPVYNANQEFGPEKTSFNKKLIEGPNYLPQLPALLIKFRYYSTVALLDISKLYSRIRLPVEDAEYQRFFWAEEKMEPNDEKAKLKAYRQTRLIFGSRSSPFQAQWVLKKHAETHDNFYLKNFTYLDDIFVGDNDAGIVAKELKNLIWILQEGDFPAQKIVSNNQKILEDLEESQKGPTEIHKIYGQIWNLKSDFLTLNFKKEKIPEVGKIFTKRECLSYMMSLYDLTGIIQPYHLKAKLIFQKSCELKLGWDEELPNPLQENFQKWIEEWPLLERITVNRCFLPKNGGKICYLASFSDSSNDGLGVNVYVVSEDAEGVRTSELAFCKAKVLPLNQNYTTPRSELAAANLSARAGNYVADALTTILRYKPKVYYFSDSEITLYRLKNKAETYKTWVSNRLKAIQDSTEVGNWKKVDTSENPSDISSRGMSLNQLINSDLFFHGPKWLTDKFIKFKNVGEISEDELSLDSVEVKKAFQVTGHQLNVLFASLDEEEDVIQDILKRHNNWRKSVNIITWIRRLWTNLKHKVENSKTSKSQKMALRNQAKKKKRQINYDELYLNQEEVTSTETLLFKYAQSKEFAEEISMLNGGSEIPKTSSIRKLIPILDENNGLLKHKSRIVGYNPIILPKDHQVTRLFIQDIHKKFGHSGPSLTLYKVRKRVWILSGRLQVKKAIYKCDCRKTILLNERMGQIPSWRTQNPTIWSRVGTDVLGPFYVKKDKITSKQQESNEDGDEDESKTIKTFAILWTDLVSRGVMVDLLYSADTEGVLRSLRKVTSIYGSAKIYYSDNASYYKKSSLEIKQFMASIDWPKVRKQAEKFNGQWLFSTEAAPFRNATSERLVSTIKQSLYKIIQKNVLPFQELQTCLLEVSAYINNRPIGFLSSDNMEDMKPVSPSLLTIGREIDILGDYNGQDPTLQELYYHRTKTIEDFLKNWTALYLQNLSPTKKWLEKNPYKIKEGMVLFIKDENKMKDLWKKGIVTKVIRSKTDNLPRTIQLRTSKSKKITRPIQKLAIPEWEIVEEEDHIPTTNHILNMEDVAIPEMTEEEEIQNYLSLKQ